MAVAGKESDTVKGIFCLSILAKLFVSVFVTLLYALGILYLEKYS